MNQVKRLVVILFFVLSLGFLMGQDGFCLVFGNAELLENELVLEKNGGKFYIGPLQF